METYSEKTGKTALNMGQKGKKVNKEVKRMEFFDYKTGKEVSREQYIANGLERGELLVSEKCGCKVIQDRTTDAYIVYCHKHNSAPDMYEALKDLDFRLLGANIPFSQNLFGAKKLARKALAKAEGK